jgi:hypothetical protein
MPQALALDHKLPAAPSWIGFVPIEVDPLEVRALLLASRTCVVIKVRLIAALGERGCLVVRVKITARFN